MQTIEAVKFAFRYVKNECNRQKKGYTSQLMHPFISVELAGVEPASKRGTNELSTCLFLDWFSSADRPKTANLRLIL